MNETSCFGKLFDDNATCFGKLFDDNATECSITSCDAREECRKTMLNVEDRKLRCMGTFDPNNRACTDACTKNKECKDLKEGKVVESVIGKSNIWSSEDSAVKPNFKVKPESIITGPIDPIEYKTELGVKESVINKEIVDNAAILDKLLTKTEIKQLYEEKSPLIIKEEPELEESSSSSASITEFSVSKPKAAPKEPKTGKISKKSVVRDNIRLLKRFKADDLVQAIVDAGLGDDTPEDMKKNRNLVTMWISEFNREKVFIITKDGAFYLLN